jgi:hypothetical protein
MIAAATSTTTGARLLRGALAGAIPIVAGAIFYALFRSRETWFVTRALDAPAIGPTLRAVRAGTLKLAAYFPPPMIDVAPDFLWALAAGAMLRAFDAGPRSNAAWAVIGGITVVGYEAMQAFHLAPGTFDASDLVAQLAGFVAGWLLARRVFAARPRGDQRSAQPASSWLAV